MKQAATGINLLLLATTLITSASIHAGGVDPLSKIVITSNNAVCKKNGPNTGEYSFEYQGNVCVTFADQSTITSDSLEIILNEKSKNSIIKNMQPVTEKKEHSAADNFKSISFKNNVCINHAQRKATASRATLSLHTKLCTLEGGVRIWQPKQTPRDVPVAVTSNKAEVSLETGQVHFVGSVLKPVSTTIVLEGHPMLAKRTKASKKNKSLNKIKNG